MTPEEKIEALREWVDSNRFYLGENLDKTYGFNQAVKQVRYIIGPPVPEWRQLVDAEATKSLLGSGLGAVLQNITYLTDGNDVAHLLARIVAICEQQVGDGWQADPDDQRGTAGDSRVIFLMEAVSRFYSPTNWAILGNRAAAWLRELTEGGSK